MRKPESENPILSHSRSRTSGSKSAADQNESAAVVPCILPEDNKLILVSSKRAEHSELLHDALVALIVRDIRAGKR